MAIIVFGPIASGKSTYISKLKEERGDIVIKDMDKEVWKYITTDQVEIFRRAAQQSINLSDVDSMDRVIRSMSKVINWCDAFGHADVIEASAIGRWWPYIPMKDWVRLNYLLVKVEADSMETRNKFLEKRGISQETARKFDVMYMDPPYWHETHFIEYKE